METIYRCVECNTEFRLDERESCRCPKCSSNARLIQRFY